MSKIRKASRKYRFLKIGVGGISGSGKTLGALRLARGIAGSWEGVCVLDTENNSSDLYAHLGPYSVYPLENTSPHNYMEAITEILQTGEFKVLIIDSLSHEWAGKGGMLEIVDNIASTGKSDSFRAWGKGTPIHNAFIESWLKAPVHLIATMRSKDEHIMEKDSKGKTIVRKVGLKNIQRDGMDYEFDLLLRVNENHKSYAEKDRTSIFKVEEYFELDEALGERLLNWAGNMAEAKEEMEKAGVEGTPEAIVKPDEAYTYNSPQHKKMLMALFQEYGISGARTMKLLSDKFEGKSFKDIEGELAKVRENKGE